MPKRSNRKTDAAQELAARAYGLARGLYLERAPGGHFGPVDYLAKEHDRMGAAVVEVIEMKCRECGVGAFPTVWAEERKVQALRKWADLYGAAGVFVVRWIDGALRRIEVERLVAVSGGPTTVRRLDRDDERDKDLVYMCPVDRMEVIECPA